MSDFKKGALLRLKLIMSNRNGIITESVFCLLEKVNYIGDSETILSYDVLQIIGLEKYIEGSDDYKTIARSIPNNIIRGIYYNSINDR